MLLALDLGTTNVKALVTDRLGHPVARGTCPVHLSYVENGGVEQDIEEIWQAALAAIRQAVGSVQSAAVEAIGISSQGGAVQVLDAGRRPLGPVISWLDQRGRPFDDALTAELGRKWFLEHICHGRSRLAIGQVLRLGRQQPRQITPANSIGFVGDLVAARLCGRAAQDGTSAGLTLLYDPKSRAYDSDLLQRLGLAANQLPVLVSPREPAGRLLPEAARAAGLPAGIPVSTAVHDQYASALGSGAVKAGAVMVGTGTAWVLLAVTNHTPAPVHDEALVCHHLVEGLWGQILSMVNGGSALTWALELTGLAGLDPDRLDQRLESVAPGSDGLLFWPLMTPYGAPGLPSGVRGRLSGLQLSHGAPHVLRAVVEGLACELNRHLDFLRNAGQPIEWMSLCGGAAASRVTPQLLADVTGLPLRCFSSSESSLLGAAILARGLLEPGASLTGLAEAMIPAARQVNPGANAPFCKDLYRRYLASLRS